MVTTPMHTLIGAAKKLILVFMDRDQSPHAMIEEIIAYAARGRKSGIRFCSRAGCRRRSRPVLYARPSTWP